MTDREKRIRQAARDLRQEWERHLASRFSAPLFDAVEELLGEIEGGSPPKEELRRTMPASALGMLRDWQPEPTKCDRCGYSETCLYLNGRECVARLCTDCLYDARVMLRKAAENG